mmetsp:Transcript_16578/g.30996  ORF Transcript_16578/g.30996 Transcript_16578/m.30996 type:complete len:396 (+) Transcript_16578:145-1332(+)
MAPVCFQNPSPSPVPSVSLSSKKEGRINFVILVSFAFSLLVHSCSSCMIQGTDSGFCDYRYHPMYYSADPTSESAWLDEGRDKIKGYIAESKKTWENGTEGACGDGGGADCLSFCGEKIFHYNNRFDSFYVPCVPRDQKLPKDRNYPEGRFQMHTVRAKDRWVHDFVNNYVYNKVYGRVAVELDKDAKDNDEDEYGRNGLETAERFTEKMGRCKNAYESYICWINFPRCDTKTNESLPMCRSACENMFESCGYPEHMWRCGDAEYFNSQDEDELKEVGYMSSSRYSEDDPKNQIGKANLFQQGKWKENRPGEVLPTDLSTVGIDPNYVSGTDTLRRDFFPGQPFKDIECDGYVDDICIHKPVCTPSFFGASAQVAPRFLLVTASVALTTVALILS